MICDGEIRESGLVCRQWLWSARDGASGLSTNIKYDSKEPRSDCLHLLTMLMVI